MNDIFVYNAAELLRREAQEERERDPARDTPGQRQRRAERLVETLPAPTDDYLKEFFGPTSHLKKAQQLVKDNRPKYDFLRIHAVRRGILVR